MPPATVPPRLFVIALANVMVEVADNVPVLLMVIAPVPTGPLVIEPVEETDTASVPALIVVPPL